MTIKKHFMLITIGVCLLGLSALGSKSNPVERPHKATGQFHVVVNLLTGTYVATGVAVSTHMGLATSYLTGDWGPPITGGGYVEAANGDRIFVEVNPDGFMTVTGGTGRFVGATGIQTATNLSDPVIEIDLVNMTMTIDVSQRVEGTLVY